MPVSFLIRSLEKRDASAVQDVALISWQHTYRDIFPDAFIKQFIQQHYDPRQIEQHVSRVEDGSHCFVVAEVDEQIVGFCHLAKTEDGIQLLRMYNRPSHMRLGIGKAFLEQADMFVRSHNMPYFYCYVHEKNEIGKSFYLKNNFTHKRQKDVRDELYMEKWV